MRVFSTRQAAKKLGLHTATLAHYIAVGKVPSPKILDVGTSKLHAWAEDEIEAVRKLLPKIANGRKTRYKKKQAARKKNK
jgi:predicted DNA-binding transcriptional regulator AlpA